MSSSTKTPGWAAPVLVAFTALAVQFAYLAESRKDPSFDAPIVDAGVYHEMAQRFARGHRLTDGAFWQPPLFPLALGCLYSVTGPSIVAAKLALAALAAASCVLVWWIGRGVFSPAVGLLAGLALALYGPFVLFSTQLLPVGLAMFLNLAAIAIWMSALRESHHWKWLVAGLLSGLATITIPNSAVLLLVAVGSLLAARTPFPRRMQTVTASVVAIAGFLLPIAAATVRNYRVGGEFVPISTNGGINFFIGNNPDWRTTVSVRPGEPWQRLLRESCTAGARTRAEQDTYFIRKGLDYVRTQPLAFCGGLAAKTAEFVSARELPRNVDPYIHREFSTVLSTLMWRAGIFGFPFGLIAPLAVTGIWFAFRPPPAATVTTAQRRALFAFILAYAASVVAFFVSARYRMPVIPVLMIFAATGATGLWSTWFVRHEAVGERSRLGVPVVLLLAAAVLMNRPITAAGDAAYFDAELYMCVGDFHATHGQHPEAERHFRRSLELFPRYVPAASKLATVLADTGRLTEAEHLLRDAITWDDGLVEPRVALASILRRQNRLNEAADLLTQALQADPSSPEAHAGYADVLMLRGDAADAIAHYATAIEFGDDRAVVHLRLADAFAAERVFKQAFEHYRRAVSSTDVDAETLTRVAWLLATCPDVSLRDCRGALELARAACEKTAFRNPAALDALAAGHAECGELDAAVQWAAQAVALSRADGDAETVEAIGARLELYVARRATRPKSVEPRAPSDPSRPSP